jgi:hypothetical protein
MLAEVCKENNSYNTLFDGSEMENVRLNFYQERFNDTQDILLSFFLSGKFGTAMGKIFTQEGRVCFGEVSNAHLKSIRVRVESIVIEKICRVPSAELHTWLCPIAYLSLL